MPAPQKPAPVKKPVYSYSQVETGKCGAKFFFDYVEKATPREETYQLVAGTIADTAFNAYYEGNAHLRETHEQRLQYARAAVEQEIDDHPHWRTTLPWSKKSSPRSSLENYLWWLFEGKPAALNLICRPDRGPVSVQMKVSVDLPEYTVVGYIDCFEEATKRVVDVKIVTWFNTTYVQYALRKQVALYRMMLKDTLGIDSTGAYELVLARKTPQLKVIPDFDVDFLQQKLIEEFDAHHRMARALQRERNPGKCVEYNRVCQHFSRCWPEIASAAGVVEEKDEE